MRFKMNLLRNLFFQYPNYLKIRLSRTIPIQFLNWLIHVYKLKLRYSGLHKSPYANYMYPMTTSWEIYCLPCRENACMLFLCFFGKYCRTPHRCMVTECFPEDVKHIFVIVENSDHIIHIWIPIWYDWPTQITELTIISIH